MCVTTATLVVLTADLAQAQSTRRPDLNLFKRGLRDPQQSLSVQGNLGGSLYDALGRREAGDGPTTLDSGWGSFGSAALEYSMKLGPLNFDGTVGAFASYYPRTGSSVRVKALPGGGLNTGGAWDLTDKTQVSVSAGLRFRPLYAEVFSASPTGVFGAGQEFPIGADPNTAFLPRDAAFSGGSYLSALAGAGIRHELTRRWSVSAQYDHQRDWGFGIEPTAGFGRNLYRQDAGVRLLFAVTRNLSLYGGYRLSEGHPDETTTYRTHSVDVGVDYGRGLELQLSRRTTLTLNGGVSGYADRSGDPRFRLSGSVALRHDIGRTWSAGAAYIRGVESGQLVFGEPILSDMFRLYLNGLLTRRVGFHASVNAQGGAFAFGDEGRSFFRSSANAGVQTALGRYLAVSADYTFYHYRFDNGIFRPVGTPSTSSSQGVYVYLSAWAPIFERGGRPNATR